MRRVRRNAFTLIELVAVTVILMIAVGMSSAALRVRKKTVSDFDDVIKELRTLCSGARVQAVTSGRERVLYYSTDQQKFLIGDPLSAAPVEGELYLKGPLKDVPEYDDDAAAREAAETERPVKPPAPLEFALNERFTFAIPEALGSGLEWQKLLEDDEESKEVNLRSDHEPDNTGLFTTEENDSRYLLFRFFPDGSGETVHPFELSDTTSPRYFSLSPLSAELRVRTAEERAEEEGNTTK